MATIKTERSPKFTFGKNIQHWKRATFAAENTYQPRYNLLQDLYTDVSLDCHLSACIQNRKANVLQCEFVVKNQKGEHIKEMPTWIYDVLEWLAETGLYGYTVLEYYNGVFNLIPRRHVIPPTGEIILDTYGRKTIKIEGESTLLAFGDPNDLGDLHKSCPIVFYKRFATAAWSEYIELFGMPMRILKTDKKDPKERQKLYNELEGMGKAAFAVIDTEDNLEFVHSTGADAYDVFDKMIERSNSEIAKLIVGQTGTTDEKSYAGAAKVHQNQSEAIAWKDKEKVKNWLNNTIFPYLKLPYTFDWVQADVLSPLEQWQIHKDMLTLGLPVDMEYLSKKYSVPFTDKPPIKTPDTPKNKPNDTKAQKKTNKRNSNPNIDFKYPEPPKPNLIERFFKNVKKLFFKNKFGDIDQLLADPNAFNLLFEHYKNTFLNGVEKGFKKVNFGNKEGYRYLQLQENAFKFAYAKAGYVLDTVKQASKDRKQGVFKTLHENYTLTEENHFTASARMAKKWVDIEETKEEFPYLQYVTAKDDHVRESHKVLDGVIRPVGDTFWETNYPPHGYNCRCTVKKLSEMPEKYRDKKDLSTLIEQNKEQSYQIFENNTGITGIAFNEQHPYFAKAFTEKQRIDIEHKIVQHTNKVAKEKLLGEHFELDFDLLPYKLSTYNSNIKSFLYKEVSDELYNLKNLQLPYINKVIQGSNILELWEAAPQRRKVEFVEKFYYLKVRLFPERYFVLELRKDGFLHFYTLSKYEDIAENNPSRIL